MSQTITEIYDNYLISPWLQEHMLRVGAVAGLICDNVVNRVRKHEVVSACLLHDMGNIIKFDFSGNNGLHEGLGDIRGLDYWIGVQNKYFEKYGQDEHKATEIIVKELGVKEDIAWLACHMGSKYTLDVAKGDNLENKIVEYSDMRVGPYGVLSLDSRIDDLYTRLKDKGRYNEEHALKERPALHNIEADIFKLSSISPEDINDEAISSIIEELRNYKMI